MAEEVPSLWKLYDSDPQPWARGRIMLVSIGLFYFALQSLVIASQMMAGNIERVFIFGIVAIFFWLLFYFVWIGVHWIRWVWGAWNLFGGFCLIIWAWRDMNGIETLVGTISLLLGGCLFSPSVHFFAKRQKEVVRWKESLLVGAASFLLLCSSAGAGLGLWAFREQRRQDACDFAAEAIQHVYRAQDRAWALTHISQKALRELGPERLTYFFADTQNRLGSLEQMSPAVGEVRMHFHFPATFETEAHTASDAETTHGKARLHFLLWNPGDHWEIYHMWWEYLPMPFSPSP